MINLAFIKQYFITLYPCHDPDFQVINISDLFIPYCYYLFR